MQKRASIVRFVCETYCPFFKPGKKENLACQGFFLINKYLPSEKICVIESVLGIAVLSGWKKIDPNFMYRIICKECPFLQDGCDFRDPQYRKETVPCGGYMVLADLWIRGNPWLANLLCYQQSQKGEKDAGSQ